MRTDTALEKEQNWMSSAARTSQRWAPSAIDDNRLIDLPPLEQRIRDAEFTLTQIRGLPFKPPRGISTAKDVDSDMGPFADEEFAPISVAEPPRLHSWEWLVGGSRKSIRHLMHERVLKVSTLPLLLFACAFLMYGNAFVGAQGIVDFII